MNYKQLAPPLFEHRSFDESVSLIGAFREVLALKKQIPPNSLVGWYPYDTLSNWGIFGSLLSEDFSRLAHAVRYCPVLDVGCGDGDLAFFLSSLGCSVTAVDHPRFNFNGMRGVRALRDRFQSDINILEFDLDSETPLELPQDDYGLVLLLGILYHLKNPFSALEKIARRSRYCMLSTRIAAVTPAGVSIQNESLAYLLDSREANGDPTNYWIFSEAGLLRMLKRASWEVRGFLKLGCQALSNPSSNDADERMYVFLRSRLRSAPAQVKLVSGWWPPEGREWCWVNKDFSLEFQLAEPGGAPECELAFVIHNPSGIAAPVQVSCDANGVALETRTYLALGEQVYNSVLPECLDRSLPITLRFRVQHAIDFEGEKRNLGVIVPCGGEVHGIDSPIHFWLA